MHMATYTCFMPPYNRYPEIDSMEAVVVVTGMPLNAAEIVVAAKVAEYIFTARHISVVRRYGEETPVLSLSSRKWPGGRAGL